MENKEYEVPKEIEEMASSWSGGWFNYRIIEKENSYEGRDGKKYTDVYYEIHEVYYDGKGNPFAWTQNPISIWFEDRYDVKDIIQHIKKATKHTILKLIKDDEGEELIDTGKYIKNIKR